MKKLSLFFAIAFFCVSVTIASAEEGKALFESRCNKCHDLERALSQSKDLKAWARTTLRMSQYSYGMITERDAEKIAEYLAAMTGKSPQKKEDLDVFTFRKLRVQEFIKPEICAKCHSEIFRQWQGSMHSKAYVDPIWRALTKLFVKDVTKSGDITEMKSCVKCHTPLGFRSYSMISPSDDYDKLTGLPAQGIFCNWCHNISAALHLGDAGYELEPGGGEYDPATMLGPFKDADSPYHPTKYSVLHTKSEFCGLCHNVSHADNKMPFEQTYNEWKNSPYNTGNPSTTVSCQDCHMRQRPGIPATGKTSRPDNPGKASDVGPERDHIWTHYFVGANAAVTNIMGSEMHAKMAVERLQNAADLQLITDDSYRKNNISVVRVKVINSGAGHYLPTGVTMIRQMWLDVKITDAAGKILLRSGALNEKGKIDNGAVLYHTKLGNEQGEVLNVALADRVLYDHRIPPKGYVIESYPFSIPDDAVSPLTIEANLKYRSVSQELTNTLLGENAPEIPVINMTGAVKEITITD